MSKSPSELALALCDAHVAWFHARLTGPQLQLEVEKLLDGFLRDARQLTLNEVATDKLIHKTVKKYAVDMDLGGAMPELVGDIARMVYRHKAHDKTRLQDLLPDRAVEEFLDKVLELKALRSTVIRESVSNPIFSDLITELLFSGIQDYAKQGERLSERVPGARSAWKIGKAMMAKASPELGGLLEDNLRAYLQKNTRSTLKASEKFLLDTFESDTFRSVMLDLWDENKSRKISDIRDFADTLDIEELFVILYEYWQHLRNTRYFITLVNAGITTFFKKFGKHNLYDLLHEIGLDRDMMLADAMLFAPPVIAALERKQMLAPLLRRHLEEFYSSDAALAALTQ